MSTIGHQKPFSPTGYGRIYFYEILIFHGLVTGNHLALPDRDDMAKFDAGILGNPTKQIPQGFRPGQGDLKILPVR